MEENLESKSKRSPSQTNPKLDHLVLIYRQSMVGPVAQSPLWLGLDLSTQSLTLVLLPDEPGGAHVYLDSVMYDGDLPQYQTEHGMHLSDGDDGEKVR